MERGQKVMVHAYPDRELERVVWQEYETYVAVCRPEVYRRAVKRGGEPESMMGFPKRDVAVIE
ncbi:MAG: hypothetical protein WC551_08075 [Patescibacteria group bacterium]